MPIPRFFPSTRSGIPDGSAADVGDRFGVAGVPLMLTRMKNGTNTTITKARNRRYRIKLSQILTAAEF
jgi:hypothetical protein